MIGATHSIVGGGGGGGTTAEDCCMLVVLLSIRPDREPDRPFAQQSARYTLPCDLATPFAVLLLPLVSKKKLFVKKKP